MKKVSPCKVVYKWLAYLICWSILSTSTAFTQDLSYQQFTIADGLPSNQVYDVHQDQEGYIWLATENGLSRYDGSRFTNYTVFDGLPDTEIIGFYEDSQHRIWFRTFNGKIGYYQAGRFYSDANTPFLKAAFFNNMIRDILEDEHGNIYFLSFKAAIKINPRQEVIKFEKGSGVAGRQLVKTRDGQVYTIGIIHKTNKSDVVNVSLPDLQRNSDIDPNLFDAANQFKFVEIKALKLSQVLNLPPSIALKESHLSSFIRTPDKLWIFGVDTPLQVFDVQNGAITLQQQISDLYTSRGILAQDGSIWLGSVGNGVYKFNAAISMTYKVGQHLAGNLLTSFYLDKKSPNIYCGSNDGFLNIITPDTIQSLKTDINKGDIPRVRDIAVDKNNYIWLVYDGDVKRINRQTLAPQPFDLTPTEHESIFEGAPKALFINDNIQSIFLTTGRGLYKIPIEQAIFQEAVRLFHQRTTTVHIDSQQNIWIGTPNSLICLPDNGKQPPIKNLKINALITSINHFKNTILVGTKGKGLYWIQDDNVQNWTTQNGLPSNLVRSIQVDSMRQNIWVATSQGLCKIDLSTSNPRLTTLTAENGLMSNNVMDCGILDSTLYVLSPTGITQLDVASINENIAPPRVALNAIYINDQLKSTPELTDLAATENNIQVDYSGIYFGNRQALKYVYQLQGYHKNWQETQQNTLLFEQLPAGRYTLELYASIHGKQSKTALTIPFEIMPAFYQKKSVQFIGLLSLLALIAYIINFIIRREKQKNRVEKRLIQLEQIALQSQMNPHFIKNALGAIQHLMIKKDVRTANKYLIVFGNLITKLLKQSDQSHIKIIDEISILELYLSIEKLRFDNNFEYVIKCDTEHILYGKIPAMMIQPLAENAILHGFKNPHRSQANKLEIEFQQHEDYLTCWVKDNGCGIEANPEQNSFSKQSGIALKNIQERISLLALKKKKTTFQIVQTGITGTTIKLCLPLKIDYD